MGNAKRCLPDRRANLRKVGRVATRSVVQPSSLTTLSLPASSRTLPRLVQTHILSPRVISRSIEKLTDILFPNGQPAPDSPDPTAEESADLRQRLERRLLEVMPTVAQYGLLGSTDTEQATTVHDMLSPLANRDINVHLAIVLLDSLVALTETNV